LFFLDMLETFKQKNRLAMAAGSTTVFSNLF